MAIPNSILTALSDWRAATLRRVRGRFAATLERAIDALLEQAEKARSNQLQASYFQAQQELRRHRADIEQRFAAALERHMAAEPGAAEPIGPDPTAELKLVNPDAFERQVVLQAIGDRAEQENYEVLHELGHRLSVLHRGAVLRPADIPASPGQLLASFDDASADLNIEHIAWKALAIVFNHGVVRGIDADLQRLNDTLREAGVLPNMKFEVSRHADAATAPPPQAPDTSATPEHGAATAEPSQPAAPVDTTDTAGADLTQIRQLLATGGAAKAGGGNPLQAAQIAELIEQRHQQLVDLVPDHGLFAAGPVELRISADQLSHSQKAMHQQRLTIKQEIGQDNLSSFDESTIDIIGALFDAMLDEADLPSTMKALFSHLQMPYLKLSMHEPELLSNPGHPARQLLDEMVSAGENWGNGLDLGKDIFPTLREIITTLHDGDTPDRNQLERQRSLLSRKIGELRRLRDLRTIRTTEAEVGRAKLEQAKDYAEEVVHHLLDSEQPCKPCQDFLTGPWHDYLTLLLLRNNGRPGGDGWAAGLALGEEVARMSRAVVSNDPPPQTELAKLRRQLNDALGELAPHYLPHIDSLMHGMEAARAQDRNEVPPHKPAPKPASRATKEKSPELSPPLNTAEKRLLGELRQIERGAQFRLPGEAGGEPRLLTVTWFNPQTDRLLFVDQNGAKADLIRAPLLARQLHQGTAERVVEEEKPSFVSRALRALRHYLEKNITLTGKEHHAETGSRA